MRWYSFFILLPAVALASCIKSPDVKPNQQTTITGRFYDSSNQEAYAGIKIKIGAYQQVWKFSEAPTELNHVGYPDSTTTDANGYYKMTFNTSGNASVYFLEFKGIPPDAYVQTTTLGGDYNYQWQKIDTIGRSIVMNFNVNKSYYLQLRVIVHNNPYPPVNVFSGNQHFQIGSPANSVYGTNNDTVDYIPILKNAGGFNLYFTIMNPATGTYYDNPPIVVNPVIKSDTTQGGTYNVYPTTFK